MAELIEAPLRIPVPGGKVIEEYVGRATTGEEAVSVAHMVAPGGWSEPAQTPVFDEITIALAARGVVQRLAIFERDARALPARDLELRIRGDHGVAPQQ